MGKVTINTGVTNSGTGFQHIRIASCLPAGNTTCTDTITWASAFADTNYTAVCTLDAIAPVNARDVVLTTDLKATTTMNVRERTLNGTAVTGGNLDCIAIHD